VQRISVIDSHTGGEPTRVIVAGGPDLGDGSMAERRDRFRAEFDHIRTAVVNEPRGSEVLVGALLSEPVDPANTAGVIFFNTTNFLGMCGHGAIGVIETLKHLGRIGVGQHRLETPVGVVLAELSEGGGVTIENVQSFRTLASISVEVPGYGTVVGDVAWGGNWFFLTDANDLDLDVKNADALMQFTQAVRAALERDEVTGSNGEWIDHIELFGSPSFDGNSGRNFVLCPGTEYDRSPCGTGTSAKMACLAADGKLEPGELWRQEGILGSVFIGSYGLGSDGKISPTIRGRAWVTGESVLLLNPDDPFSRGITR
jgi:4-hydroxyproline epimerase